MFHDLNISPSLLASASAALGKGADRFNLPSTLKDIVPETREKYLSVMMHEQRKSILREAYVSVMGIDDAQDELYTEFCNAVQYAASSGNMPTSKVAPAKNIAKQADKKSLIKEAQDIITQLLEMSPEERNSIVSELSSDEITKINRLMSRQSKK